MNGYNTRGLMDSRKGQVAGAIKDARENGNDWITLKPPSGTEVMIPLDIAEAIAEEMGIVI